MSMVFWLCFRDGETSISNDQDLYFLCHHCETLDQLSKTLTIKDLFGFIDTSDAEFNFNAESKNPSQISSMNWFSAEDGLVTLRNLKNALQNPKILPTTKAKNRSALLEELELCIMQLEQANGKEFHFQLVM